MTRTTTRTAPLTAKTQPKRDFPTAIRKIVVGRVLETDEGTPQASLIPRLVGSERASSPNSDDSSSPNEPPEFVSRPKDLSDNDEDYSQQRGPRKKGGYDSRIEQTLYENQDLQIIITDASKSHESGASYIAYTIRTGVASRTRA